MGKTLNLPWSVEQTIENLKELKEGLQEKVIIRNLHGLGEKDAEEIAFDFDRAICALEMREKQRWTPVEERLPEESLNSVIGWDEYRERCCFVQYYLGQWHSGSNEPVKVIAWMPLPEPYCLGKDEVN